MEAPKHLSRESKEIWIEMQQNYDLDNDTYLLLKVALENYDRLQECRKIIAVSGIIIENQCTGNKHINPAIMAEKVATSQFLQAWRLLGVGENPLEINNRGSQNKMKGVGENVQKKVKEIKNCRKSG